METDGRLSMKKHFAGRIFPVFVLTVLFSGCASSPPLYEWGSYETQIYAYLKGDSPVAQLTAMESDRQTIETSGKKAPPGFYAHLGMLYSNMGNDMQAIACIEKEKALFPESAVLMDYLLKNYGR